jgi:DNA-binding NarL/FixJ family response regulator
MEYAGLGTMQLRPFKPGQLLHRRVQQPPRELPLLTTRQAQVVALVREGIHSTKEIAFRMGWTPQSAKVMLVLLYRRLQANGYGVDNLTSLAIWAFAPEVLRREEKGSRKKEPSGSVSLELQP